MALMSSRLYRHFRKSSGAHNSHGIDQISNVAHYQPLSYFSPPVCDEYCLDPLEKIFVDLRRNSLSVLNPFNGKVLSGLHAAFLLFFAGNVSDVTLTFEP